VELGRGRRPDSPQPLDRKWVEEIQLAVDRHHEQPVRLRDSAGHLGEELRPSNSDRHGKPDALENIRPQPDGDLQRSARDPSQPPDIEERLVDREAFYERRRVIEHLEQLFAGLAVRIHPRADDDRVRAEPERLCAAHRRPDPVGLRLVAGCEDHAGPDDDRSPTQRRIVPLLDRRVEGVDVSVQDRGVCRHERMFASATDA